MNPLFLRITSIVHLSPLRRFTVDRFDHLYIVQAWNKYAACIDGHCLPSSASVRLLKAGAVEARLPQFLQSLYFLPARLARYVVLPAAARTVILPSFMLAAL